MEYKKTIPVAMALATIALLLSVDFLINPAYAVTGFQTYTQIDASTGTNDLCTGITIMSQTGYVAMVCRTPNNNSIRVLQADGTSIGATTVSSTSTVGNCWTINNVQAVCETSFNNGETGLRRVTVDTISSISATSFTNPCAHSGFQLAGTNLFAICTANGTLNSGTIFRVSLSSFTQTGTWTGATGTTIMPVTETRIVTLNGNNLRLYSITTSSGTATLLTTGTTVDGFGSSRVQFAYDGAYLYYVNPTFSEAISLNLSTNTFGTAVSFPVNFNDIKGVTGGYWILLGTNNQLYLLKKQSGVAPPNNFVGIQTIPVSYGSNARLGTADSEDFVISKGSTAGAVYHILAEDLHNELDNPIVTPSGTTGGIDCSLPEFSYRLICNIPDNSSLGSASTLVNQSSTNILCQVGLFSCTQDSDGNFNPDNPDIKTNGVGYLLVASAIGIFVGILWVASRGQLTEIPTFVWFIGTIAIIGAFTAIQWIDPTFIVVTIITIVGLAVAKAKGVLGGNAGAGLFRGEV